MKNKTQLLCIRYFLSRFLGQLSYQDLAHLLYLADWKHSLKTGNTITTIPWDRTLRLNKGLIFLALFSFKGTLDQIQTLEFVTDSVVSVQPYFSNRLKELVYSTYPFSCQCFDLPKMALIYKSINTGPDYHHLNYSDFRALWK